MVKTITPQELFAQMQHADVDLIDVRTREEHQAAHTELAMLMPMDEIDPLTLQASRKCMHGEPFYIICHSGKRSEIVANQFQILGIPALSVEGGLIAWAKALLPLVRHQA